MGYSVSAKRHIDDIFMEHGLIFENTKSSDGSTVFYVSVPQYSYIEDNLGRKLEGEFLSQQYKRYLSDIGVKDVIVKYRVRLGEYWSRIDELNL